MNRALLAGIVSAPLLAPAVLAQSFQFMGMPARTRESLLPLPRNWRGYAASGDLDGDGRSDLVATHELGAAVLLRSPTSWTELLRVSIGLQRPVLTDLDGDGDLDLAFLPPDPSTPRPLELYSNAGRLSHVALPAVMVGLALQGVAIGRVDGDAFADLVVATPPSLGVPPLVLVRGGAAMQFTIDLPALPAAGPSGLWPALLDADGDGDLDVLATNATSGLLLLRNNAGTFVDATATLPASRPGHVLLVGGDFDGDGRDDCAATLQNGDVDLLWGAGTLSFAPAVASVPGLRTVTPADFDGDGDLDLLAEHALGLDVLWNQGNRQFVRAEVIAEPTSMRGAGDLDNDGVADVVFAATSAEQLVRCKYRARHEDVAFAAGLLPLLEGGASISAAGDVDGDGRTDLVRVERSRIAVDHALGAHAWRRTVSPLAVAAPGGSWRTELGDLDGDQDLDLVVKDGGMLSIAQNDGTGTFTWAMQLPAATTSRDDLRLGDVDGDGDLDVVHPTTAGLMVVRNLGGGQYASAAVPGYVTQPRCVELADVDGDGDLDLITERPLGLQCIAANNGQGVFAPSSAHSLVLGSIAVLSVRAADVDADGDADVFASGQQLRVFRNDGSGTFTDTSATDLPPVIQQVTNLVNSNIVVADLDDDGDADVAMTRMSLTLTTPVTPPSWCLLSNNGAGRFVDLSAQRSQALGFNPSQLLRGADVDDDGDVDLIAGSQNNEVFSYNHLRQCHSLSLPTLGGLATLDLFSGPVFGQPGLGLLAFSTGPTAASVSVPGFAGRLELDGATLQVAAAVATSPVGLSRVFVGVPNDAALFGLEVWFQGAILPSAGAPPGFTNAAREVVLR